MSEVLKFGNPKTPISPLESPHNKQASILIIPCLIVEARLLSPIYDLTHLEANFSESKTRSQIQNPPDLRNSSNRRHLQHRTYILVLLAECTESWGGGETKVLSAYIGG